MRNAELRVAGIAFDPGLIDLAGERRLTDGGKMRRGLDHAGERSRSGLLEGA